MDNAAHADQIWNVEWTSSNKVISVSADGTAACWDVESGKKLHGTQAHPLGLISASTSSSPNSTEKVVLNSVEGTVFLWDLETQGIVAKRETFNREKSGESVSMHPSGGSYASTGNGGIAFICSTGLDKFGEVQSKLTPTRAKFGMCVKHSGILRAWYSKNDDVSDPARKLLLSASDDKRLLLHDLRTPPPISQGGHPRLGAGAVAAFSGHSSWVLSQRRGGLKYISGRSSDKHVRVWDIGARKSLAVQQHAGEVWGVSWRPILAGGGNTFVTGGEEKAVEWWSAPGSNGSLLNPVSIRPIPGKSNSEFGDLVGEHDTKSIPAATTNNLTDGVTSDGGIPKLELTRMDEALHHGEEVASPVDEDDRSQSGSNTESDDDEEDDDYSDDDDDDDDDNDNDNDNEEDEEEDVEPSLKYERLGGDTSQLLEKDSACAIAISESLLGTHSGIVHVLDLNGVRQRSYRPHTATITDMSVDTTGDFVATASIDGGLSSTTFLTNRLTHVKRPMRTIALEPGFGNRGSRAFVCGGLAGTLVLHEKGWLGHKETTLHSGGEGPVWASAWRTTLIAWACDTGVRLYDTSSSTRVAYLDRPANSPRADLFRCTLRWQDDVTLLVGWADYIKVARVRQRGEGATTSHSAVTIEVLAVLQVDCMIAGLSPHVDAGSFLVLAYITPDTFADADDSPPTTREAQRRKEAHRPELRLISRAGEEHASDALSITGYHLYGCNDYALVEGASPLGTFWIVLSPQTLVVARPRDVKDHIEWLVQRKRYEEALEVLEDLGPQGQVDASIIGQKYLQHLVDDGEYEKAAHLTPKVLADNATAWERWIFTFSIAPFVPTHDPQLGHVVYEMILGHMLVNNQESLLRTIKSWPTSIYDIPAVIVAVKAALANATKKHILMDCLAELYIANHQPGKALPYLLRLRRPNVFTLIREHNLFTALRDDALLLVEFDQELEEKRRVQGDGEGIDFTKPAVPRTAIQLLVENTHAIPINRVVQQLQSNRFFLYLYLAALFEEDPQHASEYADVQVELFAEFAPEKLIDFLRASSYYNLEVRDLVPEQVFLLGRMGDNKRALNLIIERLADVNRAIDFAKEQNDDDLWEDLFKYSETRPAFIRGLLKNVSTEIDPIRLIRRIKNGLEIPGLKDALITILQDFNLQISLLEGCQTILLGDGASLQERLHLAQTGGYLGGAAVMCPVCHEPLFIPPPDTGALVNQQHLVLLFLCHHAIHAGCVPGGDALPPRQGTSLSLGTIGYYGGLGGDVVNAVSEKVAYLQADVLFANEAIPEQALQSVHNVVAPTKFSRCTIRTWTIRQIWINVFLRMLSTQEVATHNTSESCWIIVSGKVYDVTEFISEHPGGSAVLLKHAGKDATAAYEMAHGPEIIEEGLPPEKKKGTVDPSTIQAHPKGQEEVKKDVIKPKRMPLAQVINLYDFEENAKENLSQKAWAYFSSGATDMLCASSRTDTKHLHTNYRNRPAVDLNQKAYRQVLFRPRGMIDVGIPPTNPELQQDGTWNTMTSTKMLGVPVSLPLMICPTGMARLSHPSGERSFAAAAGQTGIMQVVSDMFLPPPLSPPSFLSCISTNASVGLAQIIQAKSRPDQKFLFQLYVNKDRAKTETLVQKVVDTRCCVGIIVTIDAAAPGKREADERGELDVPIDSGISSATYKPDAKGGGIGRTMGGYLDPALTWADIAWLRGLVPGWMKLGVKGVQTVEVSPSLSFFFVSFSLLLIADVEWWGRTHCWHTN
ncbi:vacuolar assembling protein VPS41 [Rhizoctonia solani AG-1 IA]|uniref:Vacuolar assembling protein VPS41 n=1 Tax=Thanatephorus cucumeris (strain AG1-IA) TaxID=983506 RepID=L8X9C7_THACA|nr:vacuolar assembling protein VPS41 [Rhizoctonia solani AG-1 IA]